LPIWGRRKQESIDALSSAKKLIIKVKKKGIDTSNAEELYREAKLAIRNRKYSDALVSIDKAVMSAKRAYKRGIKKRLKLRISKLNHKIEDMRKENLDTKRIEKLLKEAKSSLSEGTKKYTNGLKASREGLRLAEDKLGKFNKVNAKLALTGTYIRRMEEKRPNLVVINIYKEKLAKVENLKSKGKIESALKESEKLKTEAKGTMKGFFKALESIVALEKVIKDAEVLEADIGFLSKLSEAEALLIDGKFESASEIANKSRKEIFAVLDNHKEARYHLDSALDKIQEVKNWGFSAFEAQKSLDMAKEALRNHDFEKAIAFSMESKKMASTIRERHKHSLELIHEAKKEIERIRENGAEVIEMEEIVKEAEFEFDKGDYGVSEEKISRFFEMNKEDDSGNKNQ
jgi:hypothetical protein